MMRRAIPTTVLLFFLTFTLNAQLCSQDSTGLPPLNDLGTGLFNGYQGGLYPFGQNVRPANHTSGGVLMAESVHPLDVNGVVDFTNGKTVFLCIGMSNTREEFEVFQAHLLESSGTSPYLRVVNGAQGGKDINDLLDPETDFWNVVQDTLTRIGLTADQVQVIWFKEAELSPEGVFPDYAFEIRDKFKLVMNMMMGFYPNLKLCYITSRIYGDYGDPPLNPEPFAYYNGWSVKFLIEDQINGDPALRYSGPDPVSPWLSWSAYIWADGINPRSDGLQWLCPDDFKPDGSHPSIQGREKVVDLMMDFFTTDETATPWFRDGGLTGASLPDPQVPAQMELHQNYPNPFNPSTTIEYGLPENLYVKLEIFNLLGERVRVLADGLQNAGYHSMVFDAEGLPSGIYFYRLTAGDEVATRRLILMK